MSAVELAKPTGEDAFNEGAFSNIGGLLGSFKDTKKELKGTGWNEFRKAISGFIEPATDLGKISEELQAKVQAAVNEINGELDGYTGNINPPTPIDFKTIYSEIDTRIDACERRISLYNAQLYTLENVPTGRLDKDGRQIYNREEVYHPEFQKKLDAEIERRDNLLKYRTLVDNLGAIRNKYAGEFQELAAKINNVKKQL